MLKQTSKAKVEPKAPAPEAPWKPVEPVLILRTCNADGTSYGGFQWPAVVGAIVTPEKWANRTACGNGLHGWLWGSGDWSNKIGGHDRLWYVLEVEKSDVVQLEWKVKVPRCRVLWVGKQWNEAMAFIHESAYYLAQDVKPEASATGDYGHASATGNYGHAAVTGYSGHASATGYSGHASATGDYGHASATGDHGHASATGNHGHAAATGYSGHAAATGYSGHASATGDHGHAAATGYSGHAAATGDHGHASATGDHSVVSAGPEGLIAAAWFDGKRRRLIVGYVGEDGIKPATPYRVVVTDGVPAWKEVTP